jgi:hypothetical protein
MPTTSEPAPRITISIKKKTDGSASLSCKRPDGSVTWQRQDGQQGRFFPLHDLTHYAVETVLGLDGAFYGLVAAGWNLTDFGNPWPRGPMPPDAGAAELIVGFLDTERASGTVWTAEDFNAKAAAYHDTRGGAPSLRLTEADLTNIRAARRALFDRWDALPAGDTLELSFPADGR